MVSGGGRLYKTHGIRNKGFWTLFGIYIALFIADLVTTLQVPHFQVLETNPLKKIWLICLINIIFILFLGWMYATRPTTSPFTRFVLINMMLATIFARIYAIRNALHWINNPVSYEVAVESATTANIIATQTQMSIFSILPAFFTLIVYFFFKLDHFICRKDIERCEEC